MEMESKTNLTVVSFNVVFIWKLLASFITKINLLKYNENVTLDLHVYMSFYTPFHSSFDLFHSRYNSYEHSSLYLNRARSTEVLLPVLNVYIKRINECLKVRHI